MHKRSLTAYFFFAQSPVCNSHAKAADPTWNASTAKKLAITGVCAQSCWHNIVKPNGVIDFHKGERLGLPCSDISNKTLTKAKCKTMLQVCLCRCPSGFGHQERHWERPYGFPSIVWRCVSLVHQFQEKSHIRGEPPLSPCQLGKHHFELCRSINAYTWPWTSMCWSLWAEIHGKRGENP